MVVNIVGMVKAGCAGVGLTISGNDATGAIGATGPTDTCATGTDATGSGTAYNGYV